MFKLYKKRLIAIIICLVIIILSLIIRYNSALSDFVTRYITTNIIFVLNKITYIFPFTFYELFVIALIIFTITSIILIIKDLIKHLKVKALSKVINLILVYLVFISSYSFLASTSYGRSPLELDTYNDEVNYSLEKESLSYHLDKFNSLSLTLEFNDKGVICPYTIKELNQKINDEFDKLNDDYLNPNHNYVKPLVFSNLYSEMNLTGFTFAPTGEVNYNNDIIDSEIPFTICHELSHSKGVYKENEANLLSAYLLLNSDDNYLAYCGYYSTFTSLLSLFYYQDYSYYQEARSKINSNILNNYEASYTYWQNHDGLSQFGNWFNDLYLKLNGNKNGTKDYYDDENKTYTGQDDSEGHKIYTINSYSPYQKLLINDYLKSL